VSFFFSIMSSSRFTEFSNFLTTDIDKADSREFLRMLRQVDSQVFDSFAGESGLIDDECRQQLITLRAAAQRASTVVLMGCGTSGRMCHLVAKQLSSPQKAVIACMAGGPAALVMSDELPEDDPRAGARDFDAAIGGGGGGDVAPENVLLIVVSCGLSADYCAGALLHARRERKCGTTCAIGFNRPAAARTALFREALSITDINITPILGPEAIAGSSRMKGGTAAYILLHCALGTSSTIESFRDQIQNQFYGSNDLMKSISILIDSFVVDSSPPIIFSSINDDLKINCMFACTEMVDTFGFERMHFNAILAPTVADIPQALGVTVEAWHKALESHPNDRELREISSDTINVKSGFHVILGSPQLPVTTPLHAKLALDAITTWLGIRAGFVRQNRMINLTIANAKLHERAIAMIAELCHVSIDHATRSLRIAIHGTAAAVDNQSILNDIVSATSQRMVVPRAMTIASRPTPLFGVVEGAYGPLWSDEDRTRIIELMSRSGAELNCYLYGPKDDDGTRLSWRDALGGAAVAQLRQTARRCAAHGIRFVVALHIGGDAMLELSERDAAAVRSRVRQLRDECGVHGAALFFDDVGLPLGDAAAAAWRAAAQTQAAACRALLDEWPDAPLVMLCPSAYHANDPRPQTDVYFAALGELLPARVDVLWTGDQIVSRTIVRASVSHINRLLRRRVLIWDNVTTNDYDVTRAFLAPLELRSPALLDGEVRGLLLNNPVSAALFDVPLMSLAHLARDPLRYSPHALRAPLCAEWSRTVHGLSAESCELLLDVCATPFDVGVTVPRICARLDRALAGDAAVVDAIRADLARIVRLYDDVIGCKSRAVAAALHAVLWPLKEEALLQQRLLGRASSEWRAPTRDADVDAGAHVWRGGAYRLLARHVAREPLDGARVVLRPSGAASRFAIEPFDAARHSVAALRHVCVATGDEGRDGTALLDDDPDAYPDVFVQPYINERALVVVDRSNDNAVVGYCLGVVDSVAHFAQCRANAWANAKAPATPPSTHAQRMRAALWRDIQGIEAIDAVQRRFYSTHPAHLHVDMLAVAQGHGLGQQLIARMLQRLRDEGARGVHLVCAPLNARARRLYEQHGMRTLFEDENDCVMGIEFE
jgi:N-acetylmuramic acid 6-phosphate (MurNAc-6-P) etherase/ribosomal protein S18 acetylase RimI-like enzyme